MLGDRRYFDGAAHRLRALYGELHEAGRHVDHISSQGDGVLDRHGVQVGYLIQTGIHLLLGVRGLFSGQPVRLYPGAGQ